MECVCNLLMDLMSSAMSQPILHPVMAYVFDRPDTVYVRSHMPGKDANDTCFPL